MWIGWEGLAFSGLSYLSKKPRSIVGHKEYVEGSILKKEPCRVGVW